MAAKKVWALHDFEAENPDEVSFKAGECILVVEKDDAYGDGWWQGTNPRGETGLFPFTYTTTDQDAALNPRSGRATPNPHNLPSQDTFKRGVMHSTMADIDHALTELQGDQSIASKLDESYGASRTSLASERTMDLTADDASDGYRDSDDFASRSSAARAALALNAQKNLQSANEKEKREEQRMRAEAQRLFEEEEAFQRALLLEKEKERQAKAAAGTLNLSKPDKPKVTPIAGVDMSDESDSESSLPELQDFQDKTHSPLFGSLTANHPSKTNKKEPNATQEMGSTFQNVVVAQTAPSASPVAAPAPLVPVAPVSDSSTANLPTTKAASSFSSSSTSVVQPSNGAFSNLSANALTGTAIVTSRSTSPTPIGTARTESVAFKPADQRSLDESSRGRPSLAEESINGATTTGTAATSLAAGGLDTPRSFGTGFINVGQSPSSAYKLGGDPTEWTVEQVVEWGRSKGWDEASVLGKFLQHEITGDVLVEMDVNILKEIDIIAFGKRFQVANAIKELRRQIPGGHAPLPSGLAGRSDGASSPIPPGGGFTPLTSATTAGAQSLSFHGAAGSATGYQNSAADMHSLHARMAETSFEHGATSNRSRPDSFVTEGAVSGGQSFSGPVGVAAWQAQQAGQRNRSHTQDPSDTFGREDDESVPALADKHLGTKNRRSTRSNDDVLGALPPSSPRKRESTSSGGHPKSAGDRTSFFGIGNRNRKPPPKAQGAAGAGHDDERSGKGTLSRLGFARGNRTSTSHSPNSNDFKLNISLPQSSPRYDANGDTARKASMTVGNGLNDGRQTSIGSGGAANEFSLGNPTAAAGSSTNDGPVMSRIRPVDLEGWMKKKGERYNSWKPRYLALKGPDLVILRDPNAEKIKGYVNMKGYKVIADENTNPGKYGFKILHETEKPHYFSSDDPILVRDWMKSLMKATIGRDHSFPVISSYNNATISLKEAQKMNPPPRPPSPTTRARTQRAKARQNPEQLTARDAAILMNLSPGQPTQAENVG